MKKGFTLVEIILSIALITVVGIGATIGFIQYNKNSKEKTLNNMSDEILTALRVYIETDSEAKKRIYEDYEGMAITLNKLESEGLIDFGDLDVQDDYVVAMLSNESDCSDITTVNNWDLSNGPLYICSKSNGSQNLFAVGGDAENLSQATREPYYFRGGNAKNFVKLDGDDTLYKILSVETDDSLILYRNSVIGYNDTTPDCNSNCSACFESQMCSNTLPIGYNNPSYGGSAITVSTVCVNNTIKAEETFTYTNSNGVAPISNIDIINNIYCSETSEGITIISDKTLYYCASGSPSTKVSGYKDRIIVNLGIYDKNYKIHLSPKFKIISGSGDIATPYVIKKTS